MVHIFYVAMLFFHHVYSDYHGLWCVKQLKVGEQMLRNMFKTKIFAVERISTRDKIECWD